MTSHKTLSRARAVFAALTVTFSALVVVEVALNRPLLAEVIRAALAKAGVR
jgi:hypothetical protein